MPRRNRDFKKLIKKISYVAAIAPLVGGTALNLALPFVAPHTFEARAEATNYIAQLQAM